VQEAIAFHGKLKLASTCNEKIFCHEVLMITGMHIVAEQCFGPQMHGDVDLMLLHMKIEQFKLFIKLLKTILKQGS